jgi:predicted 2-oxoglutarate/Fe(II)-dependent dioxygenase YbiX
MELKEFIKVYPNLLSPIQVSAFLKTFNNYNFFDTTIVGDTNSDSFKTEIDKTVRNTQDYNLNINKSITETHWYNYICAKIMRAVQRYKKDTIGDFRITYIKEVTLLKYEQGGFYKPHVDSCKEIHRELSIIIFLNNDFEGGYLKFYKPNGDIYFEVKPEPGSVVVWPSNFLYPHAATKVIKGTRFCIVSWVI